MSADSHPAVAIFDNYWATTLAFARSLGEKGVPLHLYGKGAGRWSRYCSKRASCPPIADAGRFLPWLRERVKSGAITRVAPTSDLIAYYTSALREEFPAEVRRTIAPMSEIEDCLIKTRFSQVSAGRHRGLETVAPESLEDALLAAPALGYPVMLKPKSHLVVGYEERGMLVDERELASHYRPYAVSAGQEGLALRYPEVRWPMLQRYLPPSRARVYSVSGIKDADRGVVTACVSYKLAQWPPHVGVSMVQLASENQRVLEAGLQIVNRVLSRGVFEIELLADGEDLYAIDLNPRAFGFIELDMARGADLPWLWFLTTRGPVNPLATPPKVDSIAAHVGLFPLIRVPAISKVSISMLGQWSDPVSKLACHLHLLKHPRSFLRSQLATARALRQPLSSPLTARAA